MSLKERVPTFIAIFFVMLTIFATTLLIAPSFHGVVEEPVGAPAAPATSAAREVPILAMPAAGFNFSPIIAFIMACIVVKFFPFSPGEVKLKFRSLEFTGTKGPIVLWCVVYLIILVGFSIV